ncbi:bifunctional glycosyltransferase family 2/GtrA family protein [Candidatus Thioglobus sp.]|nr:bifunctional glycosyltransferase family 2/GtrA family protein [Candidatus Thioglobus sp.]
MDNSFSKIAILIPTFNPNHNLIDLVKNLSKFNWAEIIIINDGSYKKSISFFDELKKFKNINILSHSTNKGKGAALKTGINFINDKFTNLNGLITVDSDGQHIIEDIIKIANEVEYRKNDVIFGVRSFDNKTPFKSMFGNKVTQYLLYLFNGISIDDSQTGLRYLPISIFNELLKLPGTKYEFELECIFAIKKLGYKITQIQIKTVYIDANKNSHFRPFIDSAKIYLVLIRFSFSSFLSFALDITIFVLLISYLESIIYATFLARIISGIFNFYLNRNFVFQVNKNNNLIKESIGYILLWLTLVTLSGLIVSSLQGSPAFLIIPFKIIVDLILFFIAFYIQKNFVFKAN